MRETMQPGFFQQPVSLLGDLPLGGGDEKKNRSFAFNHDRNNDHPHPLPSGCKGCFSLSTGMCLLWFFWCSETSGKEASSCFFPQGFGWEPGFFERLQRKTCSHCFLGHLVPILQRRA